MVPILNIYTNSVRKKPITINCISVRVPVVG
jgi:hypothetical protein